MDIIIRLDGGSSGMRDERALLRLLQLASPVLPVGAYSYSEGLEWLVDRGTICDRASLEGWLAQELRYGAVRLEAAVMVRSVRATQAGDAEALAGWNRWIAAARDTEELRAQSAQMGRSLLRLFHDLDVGWLDERDEPEPDGPEPDRGTVLDIQRLLANESCHFPIAFGCVAACWQIDLTSALLGYLQSWATNVVSAGIKLIPLGQTAGQQVLLNQQAVIQVAAQEILALSDDELSSCGWGLSLASMAHETQYSRLFRS